MLTVDKKIARKCEQTTPDRWYCATIGKATATDRQTETRLLLNEVDNSDINYGSISFWLDDEYYDGSLTDKFFTFFPEIETTSDLLGKKMKVYIELIDNADRSKKYLRVTDIAKLED